MIPHLFFYQLVLLGLLWLFFMLHAAWPSQGTATQRRPVEPILPPRKRSSDPKPFPGLTRTPPCAACEQAHAYAPQPPGCPPPRIVPTRGRPRQVETSQHFCPSPACAYQGWVGLGNLCANGHPNGGPWRQLHCTSCGGYFQETHGTPLHGKRVVPERLVWAVGALAEGLGIRAVARVFEVDPNTDLLHHLAQLLQQRQPSRDAPQPLAFAWLQVMLDQQMPMRAHLGPLLFQALVLAGSLLGGLRARTSFGQFGL